MEKEPKQTKKGSFISGLCCGAVLVGVVWAATSLWLQQTKPALSAYGQKMYDQCLMTQNGNTVACDAYMRVMIRAQEEAAAKKRGRRNACGWSKQARSR